MFTIVDIETTGLSKNYHKITEIAAVKVKDCRIVAKFSTLINPQVPIPSFITKLTGITNEMTKDAPTLDIVVPQFKAFLGEDIFVAHNATFDYGFLAHAMAQHNHELNNHKLCTRRLATRLVPQLQRKRLQDLCNHFDIENTQAHRAMADVQATYAIFLQFLDLLTQKGIAQTQDILAFQTLPVRACMPSPNI